MPAGLLGTYLEQESDPDVLSARSDISILTTRIAELLGMLSSNGAVGLWKDVAEVTRQVSRVWEALRVLPMEPEGETQVERLRTALDSLERLAKDGARDEDTWTALANLIESKSRVQAREWKRQLGTRRAIPIDRVISVVLAIGHSIKRHVADPVIESRIGADIRIHLDALDAESSPPYHGGPANPSPWDQDEE